MPKLSKRWVLLNKNGRVHYRRLLDDSYTMCGIQIVNPYDVRSENPEPIAYIVCKTCWRWLGK